MTSIADPSREGRALSWWRTLLLVGLLALLAARTPAPWGSLWVLVPASVALALLLSWRWGAWGVVVPVILLGAVMLAIGPYRPWGWWIPVAALSGAWMGLSEEGAGPGSGQRAWMLLPVLLLAAGLPWALAYPELVQRVDASIHRWYTEGLAQLRQTGYERQQLEALERSGADFLTLRRRLLPNVLPTVLFFWVAILVLAGRGLSARIAGRLKWPELSRARLTDWRLPDPAIWLFLMGLALLVADLDPWAPTGWTLLLVSGLGYCVQGIAVVESLLLARGVSPSIIVLTLLFVFLMALPMFVLSTVCVGVSDVWLDYRRLEAVSDGESS